MASMATKSELEISDILSLTSNEFVEPIIPDSSELKVASETGLIIYWTCGEATRNLYKYRCRPPKDFSQFPQSRNVLSTWIQAARDSEEQKYKCQFTLFNERANKGINKSVLSFALTIKGKYFKIEFYDDEQTLEDKLETEARKALTWYMEDLLFNFAKFQKKSKKQNFNRLAFWR